MKNAITNLLLTCLMLVSFASLQGQTAIGKWKTMDDETDRVKSIVEIYEEGGKLHGKIIELFRLPDEDQDPYCTECDEDDPRYNKRDLGMVILRNMEKTKKNKWEEGDILDPKNGKVYSCYIELLEPDKLKLRGFIGFSLLGRTQYWYRVK